MSDLITAAIQAPPKAITYAELPAVMRRRKRERFNVTFQTIDAVAGWADGYASKLLAPTPIKTIGRLSFPIIIRTFCLRLIVVDDRKALAKLCRQHKRRVSTHTAANLFCVETKTFSELGSAFWRRYQELSEPPDHLTEFLSADVAKLLPPDHALSRRSIEKLMEALCLRFLPIDDFQALSEISHRLVPRKTKRTDRRHWRYAKAKAA
jgi:hypothetical protein